MAALAGYAVTIIDPSGLCIEARFPRHLSTDCPTRRSDACARTAARDRDR